MNGGTSKKKRNKVGRTMRKSGGGGNEKRKGKGEGKY